MLASLPAVKTVRLSAELLAELRHEGKSMPIKDSLIAATALVHGLTVVTRDVEHFRVPG